MYGSHVPNLQKLAIKVLSLSQEGFGPVGKALTCVHEGTSSTPASNVEANKIH
jgi:hypothetical protein